MEKSFKNFIKKNRIIVYGFFQALIAIVLILVYAQYYFNPSWEALSDAKTADILLMSLLSFVLLISVYQLVLAIISIKIPALSANVRTLSFVRSIAVVTLLIASFIWTVGFISPSENYGLYDGMFGGSSDYRWIFDISIYGFIAATCLPYFFKPFKPHKDPDEKRNRTKLFNFILILVILGLVSVIYAMTHFIDILRWYFEQYPGQFM